jgi:RNA polymerase sigma-B factor
VPTIVAENRVPPELQIEEMLGRAPPMSGESGAAEAAGPAPRDQRELFLAWQEHRDTAARDALVSEFMPLARSLARRYGRSSEPMDDLVQVAAVGLVLAIDRFDVDRGHRFQSFAVPTILGEMRRYFRNSGWALHVPRSTQERALALREAQHHLTSEYGRAPTVDQLRDHLGYELEQVIDGLQALSTYEVNSLDAPAGGEEEGVTYAEAIGGDDQGYGAIESRADLRAALAELSERDRTMLGMSFFDEMSQSEIAARLGISQMQISRLLRRSLQRLEALIESDPADEAPAPNALEGGACV